MGYRVGCRHAHVCAQTRVAQQVVDIPVQLRAAGAGLLHRQVAAEDEGVVGHVPQLVALAVVVEQPVVDTDAGLFVRVRRTIDLRGRMEANAPPVVLVPVGGSAAADVTDGTLVGDSQEGLAEALADFVGTGQTAVAHGQAVLAGVAQTVDVGLGEARVGPGGRAPVSGVIRVADTIAHVADDEPRAAARSGIQVGVTGEPVGRVEVVLGAVVDLPVTVCRAEGAVDTGDHDHFVQITRIGHGVLIVHHGLVDLVLEFSGVGSREAAVVHVRHQVAVHRAV